MQLPTGLSKLIGKQGRMAESAAGIFAHEPEQLPIVFVKPDELADFLTEMYMDETEECLRCAEGGEWSDESFVPFAAIAYGGTGFGSGEDKFENAFAYLFWDASKQAIVWATSDDWDRSNTISSVEELGIELT